MIRALAMLVPAAGLCLLFSEQTSFTAALQRHFGNHWGIIQATLKTFFALWLVMDLNATLCRWAENRWLWKNDETAWRWQDELAVVTGGSNGIGAMVVRGLVARGIKVAVLDLEPLSDDFEQGERGNRMVTFYQCDVGSRQAVRRAAEAIRSDHGSPSILINNAGVGNANTILEVSPERLNTIFSVNLLSHWHTVQEFLPDMIARKKGHVMSTASMSAFLGLAGMVDYSCTKAGLVPFHEGLNQELKHRYHCPEIKTTIVYPNWTRTRLTRANASGIKNSGSPIVEPKHVAEAMVNHIIARKSGQLILGPGVAVYIRALPIWLQEFIRDRLANVITVNASTAVVEKDAAA